LPALLRPSSGDDSKQETDRWFGGEREGKRGEGDTLVVHFRSGDIYTYRDSHHSIAVKDMWQPPLAFYVLAIHTHVINFPNAPILFLTEPTPGLQNVCIQRLLDVFPQARALYSTKEPHISAREPCVFHKRALYKKVLSEPSLSDFGAGNEVG